MPVCKKIILFYESRKLEVLQMLSNPFKSGLTFGKPDEFVLELAAEQAKIEDQIWFNYRVEFMLFIKACRFYGFMAADNKNQLNRDAEVLKNNAGY